MAFISTRLSSPPRMKVVGPKTPAAYIAMEETMTLRKILLMAAVVLSVPVVPALAHDDETTATPLTIGSTTNWMTRTNAPTSTAFIVLASTVPIIGHFGTFTTRVTDICDTIIIRGLIITVMATVIEVGSQLAKPPPRERAFAILRTRSELQGKELE